ncbi:hypothetical protein QAD02_000778 [Eretmocerus hayati]|uniref:Uncharacterized protein n=1 Tax=Eretmocerus hayati TaxID=131215 RepID=A0ACC2NE68_9HYME|nr:hypothetical protein QAD02_000778 [Eretmocerus hayati]
MENIDDLLQPSEFDDSDAESSDADDHEDDQDKDQENQSMSTIRPAPPRRNCKKKHDAWVGYHENDKEEFICIFKCGRTYKRRDKKTLARHTRTCQNNPNRVVLENVTDDANAMVPKTQSRKRRSDGDPSQQEFVSALDPHHTIPAVQEFPNIIASQSLKSLMIAQAGGEISNVMWVQCSKTSPGADEITPESFLAFCIKSVETVYDFHKVQVALIIHDMRFDCPDIDSYGDHKIHLLKSFSISFSNLERIIDSFDGDDLKSQYKSKANELQTRVKANNSMGSASRIVRKLLSNELFKSNKNVVKAINEFLKPIHFTCEFVIPKYQVNDLNEEAQFAMNEFLIDVLHNMDDSSAYLSETEYLCVLFSRGCDDNPEKFWKQAMMKHPKLSKLALGLIRIPAVPRAVEFQQFSDIYDPSWDENENLRVLTFAIFFHSV